MQFGGDEVRHAAGLGDGLDELPPTLFVPPGDGDVRTAPGERHRSRQADPAGPSGHQGLHAGHVPRAGRLSGAAGLCARGVGHAPSSVPVVALVQARTRSAIPGADRP
ncbi:hypothetical protein GCM10010524_09530 [Streptomyces mexicanus]